MSDERTDLIPGMLRAIRAEQATQREKLDEIVGRLGALEREVASLTLRIDEIKVDLANFSLRFDNLDRRVAHRTAAGPRRASDVTVSGQRSAR